MKTSTTFKGASKPYGVTGHFDEPMRHKLQGMGIKTGHIANGVKVQMPVLSRIYPQFSSWTDKSFKVNDHIEIMAGYRKMRDGFNHYAVLYVDGVPVDEAKAHYINRTWESYDYQSVMQSLVNKTKDLSPEQKAEAKAYLEKGHADMSDFKMTAMIAKLGDVMTSSKKESNDWKERMIKAGLGDRGLEMPEDWDTLSEETKEARLNAVIKEMGEAGKHEDGEEHQRMEVPKESFVWNKNLPRWEGNLPEQTLHLILRRLNGGKLKYDEVPFPDDGEGIPLTPEQVEKGRAWLVDQWKTPTGAERKNNPFGYREQAVLEKFETIKLHGFYDSSRYGGKPYYLPLYEAEGDNTSFEYYVDSKGINIVG